MLTHAQLASSFTSISLDARDATREALPKKRNVSSQIAHVAAQAVPRLFG